MKWAFSCSFTCQKCPESGCSDTPVGHKRVMRFGASVGDLLADAEARSQKRDEISSAATLKPFGTPHYRSLDRRHPCREIGADDAVAAGRGKLVGSRSWPTDACVRPAAKRRTVRPSSALPAARTSPRSVAFRPRTNGVEKRFAGPMEADRAAGAPQSFSYPLLCLPARSASRALRVLP